MSRDGYGLHAGVVIGACERKGLERLCRYIARPPLAKSRLETREDGTVVIRLKQPWADGTGAIQLSRLELMERLAALVPPPRKNQVLYHGVLASRAAWREEIVPQPKRKSQVRPRAHPGDHPTRACEPKVALDALEHPAEAGVRGGRSCVSAV